MFMEHIDMKKCLNCGYERQPKDEGKVPATECPRVLSYTNGIKDGGKGLEESADELNYAGRITRYGLSFGARITLAVFAGFFGVIMLHVGSGWEGQGKMGINMFGTFCLFVAVACVTTGRVRQFVGSIIGCALCTIALWYVVTTSSDDSLTFFVIFGIPGVAYAYKVRFGFSKRKESS